MSKKTLEASLALWRRRHRWNQRMRARARKRGDDKAARRYGARLAQAVIMIQRRKRQLAALAARKGIRARTVAHARSFVGTVEDPPGSNTGPNISAWQRMWLGVDGVAYCGAACGAWLAWAGVKGLSWRIVSVAYIEDDAKAQRGPFRGWTTSLAAVLPGDLVVIGGRGVHVEMVERVNRDGSVETVGANTSPDSRGSQSNGGGVWPRTRRPSEIHGFALVDFPN